MKTLGFVGLEEERLGVPGGGTSRRFGDRLVEVGVGLANNARVVVVALSNVGDGDPSVRGVNSDAMTGSVEFGSVFSIETVRATH